MFLLLVLFDVFMDSDLLSHDALQVNLFRIIIVLEESNFDSFLQSVTIDRQFLIWESYAWTASHVHLLRTIEGLRWQRVFFT